MDSNAIEIKNVTMQFNLERERTDNVKEFFIKKMKRKLQIDSFIALKNVSFKVKKRRGIWPHWGQWKWKKVLR